MGGNEFDTIVEKRRRNPYVRKKIGKFGFIDPLAQDLQFMFGCDENPMPHSTSGLKLGTSPSIVQVTISHFFQSCEKILRMFCGHFLKG